MKGLREGQRKRLEKEVSEPDAVQLQVDLDPEERSEREADRRFWGDRLVKLDRELTEEPDRLRRSYEVRAHRIEPVGLVYLWPTIG